VRPTVRGAEEGGAPASTCAPAPTRASTQELARAGRPAATPEHRESSLRDLVQRAAALQKRGGRRLLGITGPPGAGKSTVAAAVVQALQERALLVPMDGFHLADAVLDDLGRRDRKGAPDTFDAAGFLHLLRRVRDCHDDVVYAPAFVREQEQAIAGALAVPRDVPLVVVEGNYLLLDEGPFAHVRALLSETWYLDLDPGTRVERHVARHVQHGRTTTAAQRWVADTDEQNARLIEGTRSRADLVVRLGMSP
jgi:pantothenate kinase